MIVFTDLDGTLLDERGELGPAREALERLRALGVPVVVLRNVTERPEGLKAGILKLAGTDPEGVYRVVKGLLENPEELSRMRKAKNPYGDGKAGLRVARGVACRLGLGPRPEDWRP